MEKLLMLGDSLIEWGDWDTLLPDFKVINRGFAGETVGGLAGRLADEVEMEGEPDRLVILSGTNDLLMGNQTFTVVFETMLPRVQLLWPDRELIVVGLAPLQMAMLEPRLAILDETDSGLDIDALKVVADGVNALRAPDRS